MRRALNGEVTIIRPEADRTDAPSEAPTRSLNLGVHEQAHPGPDHWPPALRYPRLLAQIRVLEQEARDLKQRESTVRWVAQAIRLYDLTASDIGL